MKKILVPIDFSEQCVHAFRFSVDIARRSQASITLLHVIALPVIHDSPLIPVSGFRKPLMDELEAFTEKKMAAFLNKFGDDTITVNTKMVTGSIHDSILGFIKEEKFDLIVMGTKGASGIREWTIGSNTEKMVRTSPVPLIAVKHHQSAASIKHIVFPNSLDTEDQEDLIMKVKALQDFFSATLHIIWVNTPALFRPDDEVRKRLNAFAQRYMLKDYTINVFNYSNEETGILEFTREINGDLIALGTHGHRGLAHIFAGSIAEDVVNHVRFPVWTYCPKSAKALSAS